LGAAIICLYVDVWYAQPGLRHLTKLSPAFSFQLPLSWIIVLMHLMVTNRDEVSCDEHRTEGFHSQQAKLLHLVSQRVTTNAKVSRCFRLVSSGLGKGVRNQSFFVLLKGLIRHRGITL
jgi:hypothetical protein